jgi:hypothetical protein
MSGFIPISPLMLLLLSAFIVWQAWKGFRVAQIFAQFEAQEGATLDRAMRVARSMSDPRSRK